jgi:hypothetical protein
LKRNAPQDDDDSVDSKGNIRGLIVSDESESEFVSETESASDDDIVLTKKVKEQAKKRALRNHRSLKKKFAPKKSKKIVEESEEEDEEEVSEEEEVKPRKKNKLVQRKKKVVEESEEESEEEEEEQEEEDEDEEYDEDDEDEDDEDVQMNEFKISIGGFGDDFAERMVPKRHNMKKESKEVRKFVELISKPYEENTIDDQIDQFKGLSAEKQGRIMRRWSASRRRPRNL